MCSCGKKVGNPSRQDGLSYSAQVANQNVIDLIFPTQKISQIKVMELGATVIKGQNTFAHMLCFA